MLYRDERKTVKGVANRSTAFTSNRHIHAHASSLADLLRWFETTPKVWPTESSTRVADKHWALGATWEDALKLASTGWPEGVAMIDTRLQAVLPATGKIAGWGHSCAGSSVNVGRFLRGHPKPMRSRRKRESGTQKVLHLVINGVASCNVTAEQMANYGVAIVGLISRLETGGRRVHLDVCFATQQTNGIRASVGWTVKGAQDRLNLHAVAFSIAHPAAFRRFGFAALERLPKEAHSAGYGYAADIQPEDMVNNVHGAMLVDGVSHAPKRCNTPQDALRLAIEQVNKAAVLAGHATPDTPLIEESEFLIAA